MIDITKTKADAEEGLRIAESATGGKWRSTWDDPHHEDFDESSAVTTDLDGAPLRGMVVGVMWHDGLHVACRRENAEFISDSRTRAPEAYRNVIEMAGVIDKLVAERNDLESRFADVSADYREEHKRLVAMGVECDNLRAQWDAGAIDREARMMALRDLVEENGKLRAEVARLGAPGATMDGAPQ